MGVISAAARLLLNEMRCRSFEIDFYPFFTQQTKKFHQELIFLPPMFRYFKRLLVGSEIKQAAIRESLMKAMKSKSVIPKLFGQSVEMDHIVGLKTLIIEFRAIHK